MEMLQTLLENESIQTIINENENLILENAQIFHDYPQFIKTHIQENLENFIVPGNIKATYENMVQFTESSVVSLLEELTSNFN